MNEAQLDDLKQFITVTVSQTEQRLQNQITGLCGEMAGLQSEMTDGFSGVGEAIEIIHNQLSETDKRLAKLERHLA